MTDPKRRELGDFLRARRSRLSPEAVGLPHRRRGAPLACAARKWPNSPASASIGTFAWNRAVQ